VHNLQLGTCARSRCPADRRAQHTEYVIANGTGAAGRQFSQSQRRLDASVPVCAGFWVTYGAPTLAAGTAGWFQIDQSRLSLIVDRDRDCGCMWCLCVVALACVRALCTFVPGMCMWCVERRAVAARKCECRAGGVPANRKSYNSNSNT